MTDQHPITPPPELIKEWMSEFNGSLTWPGELALHTANRAAEWGYDQRGAVNEAKLQKARDEELEACCAWLNGFNGDGEMLRIDRRPKPPSLKEQALKAAHIELDPESKNGSLIICALEAIPDD